MCYVYKQTMKSVALADYDICLSEDKSQSACSAWLTLANTTGTLTFQCYFPCCKSSAAKIETKIPSVAELTVIAKPSGDSQSNIKTLKSVKVYIISAVIVHVCYALSCLHYSVTRPLCKIELLGSNFWYKKQYSLSWCTIPGRFQIAKT